MTQDNQVSSTICRWAFNTRYEDLPAEVRSETVTILYDQIGCMIAGATLPSCKPVISLIRRLNLPGGCSIVGHPLSSSVTHAALANGTIAHADEVDSTGKQGTGHFASMIVPAALTVGQYVQASGREVCRAITVGSEVAGRVVTVLNRYHDMRKQFEATTGHALGAAISAGLLLSLDAEQLEHALGLAAAGACGLTSQHDEELHQTKSLQAGRAAELGVVSALLSQEGCHAPREPLTIENGFFDAFLGLRTAGDDMVERLGENYIMREVAYKRYSVGGPDQTPLYAFVQMMHKHKLSADDIVQIEVLVSRGAFHVITTNKNPAVHLETILSLAAIHGELTFSHVHDPSYLQDPSVTRFRERVRIFVIPRPGPATRGQRLETRITLRTADGRDLTEDLRFPPMTEPEVRTKFKTLAGLRLDQQQVETLEARLLAVEAEKSISPLMKELEIVY